MNGAINGICARMDFDNAVDIFSQAFPRVKNVVEEFKLTQSDLILEQPQAANNNNYLFPVMNNIISQGGVLFNTEIRLNQQDTFLPQYIGFFLCYPSSTTDTTWVPLTYANPFIITNAVQARAYYQGQLKMMVNNTQYLNAWSLSRHYQANQTQQTAATGVGSPLDQQDLSVDGFYPFQPYVLISGSSNMQINVLLPVAPTAVDANSRLRIVFRGALAQNSTSVT